MRALIYNCVKRSFFGKVEAVSAPEFLDTEKESAEKGINLYQKCMALKYRSLHRNKMKDEF